MTNFGRRGHWRTNANGTRFWVSEHEVSRDVFSVSVTDGQHYVNGCRLSQTLCKFCYNSVHYASLPKRGKVFFNLNTDPLTIHNCRKKSNIETVRTPTRKPKKFLSEADAKALDRRAEEQKKNLGKNLNNHEREAFLPMLDWEKKALKGQLSNSTHSLKFLTKRLSGGRYKFLKKICEHIKADLSQLNLQITKSSVISRRDSKKIKGGEKFLLNMNQVVEAHAMGVIKLEIEAEFIKTQLSLIEQEISKFFEFQKNIISIEKKQREARKQQNKKKKSNNIDKSQEQALQKQALNEQLQRRKARNAAESVVIEIKNKKSKFNIK